MLSEQAQTAIEVPRGEGEIPDRNQIVERTAGVSGAVFGKYSGELVISQKHMDDGLAELLIAGGALTQSLLGSLASAASSLISREIA